VRQIKSIFVDHAELASLASQADSIAASQKIWNSIVPDALKNHTQATSIKHKRLTVYADNGAIAAKIKLLLPSLLTKLQKQELEVTSIRVLVQVQSHAANRQKPPRNLSENASKNLKELAEKLEGSTLAEVLDRLASRVKES